MMKKIFAKLKRWDLETKAIEAKYPFWQKILQKKRRNAYRLYFNPLHILLMVSFSIFAVMNVIKSIQDGNVLSGILFLLFWFFFIMYYVISLIIMFINR